MNTGTYLVTVAWISWFIVMSISTAAITILQFCQSNTIDHLFCDIEPILQLSSTDTYLVEIEALVITIFFCLVPFILILVSYVLIFSAIMAISSKNRRMKKFSTCSSHLSSACMYFGALFFIYLVPSKLYSMKLNKMISLAYTVLTPLLNPLMYSLRNLELRAFLMSFCW